MTDLPLRKCPACHGDKWYARYIPLSKFLWWKWPPRLKIICKSCGYVDYVAPGSITVVPKEDK